MHRLSTTYLRVFGELPPAASCDKLVQMQVKLKPDFMGQKIRRRPYRPPKEQADEIERQIQECINVSGKVTFAASSGKKLTAEVVKSTDQVSRTEVQYDVPHVRKEEHLRSILGIFPPLTA